MMENAELGAVVIASLIVFFWPVLRAYRFYRRTRQHIAYEMALVDGARSQIGKDLSDKNPDTMTLTLLDSEITAYRYVQESTVQPKNSSGDFKTLASESKASIAGEIVQHLIRGAKTLQRDNLVTCQLYTRKLDRFRYSIRTWPQVAQRLGILGTFVGLVIGLLSLTPTSALWQPQTIELGVQASGGSVGMVLQSMSLAFCTSIAGLLAWFVAQNFVQRVDLLVHELSSSLTSLWLEMDEMLTFARFKGVLPASVERLAEQTKILTAEMRGHGLTVREEVDRVVGESHIGNLELKATLSGFQENQQTLKDIQRAHKGAIEQVAAVFQSAIDYEQRLGSAVSKELRQITDDAARVSNATTEMAINRLVEEVGRKVDKASQGFVEQIRELNERSRDSLDIQNEEFQKKIDAVIRSSKEEGEQLLKNQLMVMEEAHAKQWEHVSGILDKLVETPLQTGVVRAPSGVRLLIGSAALSLTLVLGLSGLMLYFLQSRLHFLPYFGFVV